MNTRPKITISTLDSERLESLLESLPDSGFPGRDALEAELLRADVVPPKEIPPTTVTMNSTVKFQLLNSNEEYCLKLVYPGETDINGGTISIFAPVGSALLGLSEGDEIEWPRPGGGMLRLAIKEVIDQPERSGNYDS